MHESSLRSVYRPSIPIQPSPTAMIVPGAPETPGLPSTTANKGNRGAELEQHTFILLVYYLGIIFKDSYLHRFFAALPCFHAGSAYKRQTVKTFPFVSRSPALS